MIYAGSVLAIDIKGELCAASARHRRKIGQPVFALDPWGIIGQPIARFNPMRGLADSPDPVDEAQAHANAVLYRPPGSGGEPHWIDSARTLWAALVRCQR